LKNVGCAIPPVAVRPEIELESRFWRIKTELYLIILARFLHPNRHSLRLKTL
jgi:hypothetical protein